MACGWQRRGLDSKDTNDSSANYSILQGLNVFYAGQRGAGTVLILSEEGRVKPMFCCSPHLLFILFSCAGTTSVLPFLCTLRWKLSISEPRSLISAETNCLQIPRCRPGWETPGCTKHMLRQGQANSTQGSGWRRRQTDLDARPFAD